jgi:predicted nucleic acid-binding protein
MKIVVDTSPLIAFAILQKLELLPQIFDEIWLPTAVFQEATTPDKPYHQTIAQFAQDKVQPIQNRLAVQLLINDVDLGEAEAIVLALENGIDDLLIDDAKGRRVARLNGLYPMGTIGVLLQAKQTGHIPQVKPHLDMLIANKIRIGASLYHHALQLAKESP